MNFFSFLLGPSGKFSAARVNTTIVVACTMAGWLFVTIKKVEMAVMPEYVFAALATALGFQVWHKSKENGKENENSNGVA